MFTIALLVGPTCTLQQRPFNLVQSRLKNTIKFEGGFHSLEGLIYFTLPSGSRYKGVNVLLKADHRLLTP